MKKAPDTKIQIKLVFWFIASLAMIGMGIIALVNHERVTEVLSFITGLAAIITGIITLSIRRYEKVKTGSRMAFDWILWIILGILFFNTDLFTKIGKVLFIIVALALIVQGIGIFVRGFSNKADKAFFIPRIIFAAALAGAGVFVLTNAGDLFVEVLAVTVGLYLIIHGAYLFYEWIGEYRYFNNYRGTEE